MARWLTRTGCEPSLPKALDVVACTREAHAQMAGPLKHTATRYVVYMRTGCWGWRRCGIDSVVSDWRATSKHPLRTLYLFSSSFRNVFFLLAN